MKTYKLQFGWEIKFPEEWIHEINEDGVDMFFPPNDTTTAYASVFTACEQNGGEKASAEILEEFFVKSLSACDPEEISLNIEGLGSRAFFSVTENGVYRISVGVFTAGNLLLLNVFSENKDAVYAVAEQCFSEARFTEG